MTKNELKLNGTQKFMGIDIPVIEGGFGENCRVISVKSVSEIHGVTVKSINQSIKRNIQEFEIGIDLLDLCDEKEFLKDIAKQLKIQLSNGMKHFYVLSERGYLKFYSLLRNKNEDILMAVKSYFKNDKLCYDSFVQNKEIRFRDRLSTILKNFNIDTKYQYSVGKYFIDIYIPSLNVAIEYDENNHKNYTYEQHELRQKEIEMELGCHFIRVSDEYNIDTAIGIVLNKLMKLREEFREAV